MFFEVFSKGNLIVRGKKWLGTLQFDHELNYAPSLTMVLPIDWNAIISGREEFKIHFDDGKVFWGIVWDYDQDKVNETMTLDIRHVITEWQYRQISVNHAMSNKQLNIVYKGDEITKSETEAETITASGFTIGKEEASSFTNDKILERSRAYAWNNTNGDKIPITGIQIQKCEVPEQEEDEEDDENANAVADEEQEEVCTDAALGEEGNYKITLSTAKGTAVTIEVNVEEKYEPDYSTLDDPTVADKLLDIYNDTNFAYPGWNIEWRNNAQNRYIDYVYSKQNKLDALTETVELTEDLWWRVGFWNEKRVQIGTFGDLKPYVISGKKSGSVNIRMIQEPTIEADLDNVINVATVYSDKSDGGMSSLTLREVYMNPSLQKQGFPVVILHSNVNNERDYRMYISQFPTIAPNNEVEFAILDEASIALESGTLIEDSYSFNDLSPFEIEGNSIDDAKRIKAGQTVYNAVVKKLIQSRRSYDLKIVTERLPIDVLAGDKIRLIYDNKIWEQTACGNYWKKIVSYNDNFYITHITYVIDEYGNEYNELTLTKWLKIERETANTQG